MTDHFLRVSILSLTLILCFASSATPETPEEIDIEYQKQVIGRTVAGRPSLSLPAAGSLPRTLAEVPGEEPSTVERQPLSEDLETRAAIAATWAARQKINIFGRREIYTAGFFDGLQAAFRDPLIGDWDYRQGGRDGRRDRGAYRVGSEIGREAARRAAGNIAYTRLTVHTDSGPEPGPTAAFSAPLPPAREPRLLDVFDQLPASSFLEHEEYEPLLDPWKLYRSDTYDDFYDRSWADPARAFGYWLDHHRDRAFWREINDSEQSQFQDVFLATFRRQLPELLAGAGDLAYSRGHDEGWKYAVAVVQEHSYRKGYHEGFGAALAAHAESAFYDSYPAFFDQRYNELVHEGWSAAPEIGEILAGRSGTVDVEPVESY